MACCNRWSEVATISGQTMIFVTQIIVSVSMLVTHVSLGSCFSWNTAQVGRPSPLRIQIIQQKRYNFLRRSVQTTFTKPYAVTPLFLSENGDLSPTLTIDDPRDLPRAYQIGKYAFLIAAIVIFLIPDRTLTTLLAAHWGGAAGFALAAGICHILRHASLEDRLQSDTYKRLNLGLLGFCGIGLTAVPAEAGFLSSFLGTRFLAGILFLLRIFGCILAWNGWCRGITLSTHSVASELAQGIKSTIQGIKVQSSKKALTYRNCLLLVCCGIVSSFMEGLFFIRYQQAFYRTWFEITLQWSAVARLFLIATIIYSLKDAAERDRLTGNTFIQLNLMVGAWAVLVGLGQAIYPLGFAAYRGVEMFAFAIPFLLKAYKSQKEKRSTEQLIKSSK
jgi:hypothetical protein